MNNAHYSNYENSTDNTDLSSGRAQLEDTYFLDRECALKVATQRNIIIVNDTKQIQRCYYDGPPFAQSPDNLIPVPINEFIAFFSSSHIRIPTYLCNHNPAMTPEEHIDQQAAFQEILEEVRQIRNSILPPEEQKEESTDCYFFDRNLALEIANQQNRIATIHPSIDGLQICYYDGELIENAPQNLINVKFKDILSFLINTRLRYPSRVIYPTQASATQQHEITQLFNRVINEAGSQREQLAVGYENRIRAQQPAHTAGEPFRIYFRACRLTTVMQYVSRNLAKTFESLGHHSLVSVEDNDMEILHKMLHLKGQYEFDPHICININHPNNQYLNEDVVNIVWWQDPMPLIKKMQPLHWRKKDVVFSLTPPLDKYLVQCGAKNIQRQLFCTDTHVFNTKPDIQRENKIIFVGASYITHLSQNARNMEKNADALRELASLLELGTNISEDIITQIAKNYDMDYEHVFWNLYHVVVRNKTVEWLCEYTTLPVEVYGYEWEFNNIVKPFYKGSLQHGEELVNAYNSARYTLVSHPFEVNSQRLNEATACGCIPLVYDCRHSAEQPHWDNELMYFKTRNDLYRILDNNEGTPVPHIGEHFSYESLAKRIIGIAEEFYQKQSTEA